MAPADGIEKLGSCPCYFRPKRSKCRFRKWGSPTITNDGVTIAKEIELKIVFKIRVSFLKEVASKTNDIAGDGTTSATILGHAIFKEGLKNVVAGSNPMELKRGIQEAVNVIVEGIKGFSQPVETKDAISQVASISANNDETIGNLIADAMEKVGKEGVITVEESKGINTELEVVEGMQFDKGYISLTWLLTRIVWLLIWKMHLFFLQIKITQLKISYQC